MTATQSATAEPVAVEPAKSCCSATALQTCCAPEAKAECCGTPADALAAEAPSSCGCQ
ncbi:hypothetical protein [Streptosporangium sp. NPDC000396]|uniref:hypothetical protein n=1 Tax=Streptosporangium sp. NPDC000396 TaxID=3366185 RepID=UPI0036C37B80